LVIVKGLEYEKEDVNLTSLPNEALKKGILWTFYSTLKLRAFGSLYELFDESPFLDWMSLFGV
jgi:hypothetical protein